MVSEVASAVHASRTRRRGNGYYGSVLEKYSIGQ
jgi:hypothetical protein